MKVKREGEKEEGGGQKLSLINKTRLIMTTNTQLLRSIVYYKNAPKNGNKKYIK